MDRYGMATGELSDADVFGAPSPHPKEMSDAEVFGSSLGHDQGAAISALQGFNGTVPFGNRLTAAMGAAIAKPVDMVKTAMTPGAESGGSFSDFYNEQRASQKATETAHPGANLAGAGAGIIATLPIGLAKGAASSTPVIGDAANGLTKATTAVSDYVGGASSLGGRIARGASVAAPTGAVYGYGAADEGQRLEGAALGAGVGAAGAVALPVAGAVAGAVKNGAQTAVKGALSSGPEVTQQIASGMKSAASGLYDKMRSVGATLNTSATQDLITNIDSAVAKQKFIPNLNPKTVAIIDDMKQAAQKGDLGVDELDQYRRLLGKVGGSEDGVSAGSARRAIDDYVNHLEAKHLSNGSPDAISLLNQGRAQYAQASKFEDIADILTRADGDPNKIKSGLTRFMQNEKNTRGWSQEELDALENAASSGVGEKLLKMGGKFGFDLGTSTTSGNTVAPIVGALTGGAVGGIGSAGVVPVAGTIARQGQKYLARGKAEQLLDALAGKGGAPIAGKSGSLPPAALSAGGALINQAAPSSQIPISPAVNQVPHTVTKIDPLSYEQTVPKSDLLGRIAHAESGGNPNAKASTSSASGLFQFTNGTWKDMVNKYGNQMGVKLSDKANPTAQQKMAQMLLNENAQAFRNKGIQPNDADLYLAHFLGASQAIKVKQNLGSQKLAAALFPKAAEANPSIFYNKGQPRTVDQMYQILAKKVS